MTYDDSDGILCRPGGPRHHATPGPYCLARCYCPGASTRTDTGIRTTRTLPEWRADAWKALRGLAETGERFTTGDLLLAARGEPGTHDLAEGLLHAAANQRRIVPLADGSWQGAAAVRIVETDDPIQERFLAYHAANPWVYEAFVRLARIEVAEGKKRIGIGALTEALRWEHRRATRDTTSTFKLSNDYRSRYARLIMRQEADLAGVFQLRELRAP